jgi:hypothetical protein
MRRSAAVRYLNGVNVSKMAVRPGLTWTSLVYPRDMERGVMELALNHGFAVWSVKFVDATARHLVVYTGICLGIFKIKVLSTTTLIYAFSSHTCQTTKKQNVLQVHNFHVPFSGRRASSFSNVQTGPWAIQNRPPLKYLFLSRMVKNPIAFDSSSDPRSASLWVTIVLTCPVMGADRWKLRACHPPPRLHQCQWHTINWLPFGTLTLEGGNRQYYDRHLSKWRRVISRTSRLAS